MDEPIRSISGYVSRRCVVTTPGVCSAGVYYVLHMTLGAYIRSVREQRRATDRAFSVRQVAQRVGIEPSYLSKIEREVVPPPSEATICKIARELGEDSDLLLAMVGKISSDLREIILDRPMLFTDLIRHLREAPDHELRRITREVRDGGW